MIGEEIKKFLVTIKTCNKKPQKEKFRKSIVIRKQIGTYSVFKENSHYNNTICTHILSTIGNVCVQYQGCFISNLVVKPEYRNLGIGTEILKLSGDLIRKEGWEYCELFADRESLIPFYEKLGYKVIKKNDSEILMRKTF